MSFKIAYVPSLEGEPPTVIIHQDGWEDKCYERRFVELALRSTWLPDERRSAMEAAMRMFERKNES